MGLDFWIDWNRYRRRLAAARRRVIRGPSPEEKDPNRRWRVMQYMLEVGAYAPEEGRRGVTTTEVADAMGIALPTASRVLSRLRESGWTVKLGGHFGYWYLTPKALRFAESWGGFLNHPWVRGREEPV